MKGANAQAAEGDRRAARRTQEMARDLIATDRSEG
jgi:hypothetical protein